MANTLSLLVIEDDEAVCGEYARLCSPSRGVTLIGTTNSSQSGLQLTKEKLPDAVVLDLELHNGSGNGLMYLSGLQELTTGHRPYVMVVTNNISAATHSLARKMGADFIITKNQSDYSVEMVLSMLRSISACLVSDNKSAVRTVEAGDRSDLDSRICKELDEIGIKELNIIAQDTSRYGLDIYGEYALAKLVHAITDATSIPWIRLLYCYPDKITDELIAEMRDNDRVVKYIDLPLQHISDSVLKRMNRHGDSAMIRELIAKLRREIPDLALRTTFIVGFPGETEEDFETLCDFVEQVRFEHLGVFPYSAEEGTPAARLPDQIDEQVKQDRADIIMKAQMQINTEQNEQKIGKIIRVLVEDFDPVSEAHFGRSAADAPEIDGKVYFKADRRVAPGSMIDVKIRDVVDYDLYGRGIIKD